MVTVFAGMLLGLVIGLIFLRNTKMYVTNALFAALIGIFAGMAFCIFVTATDKGTVAGSKQFTLLPLYAKTMDRATYMAWRPSEFGSPMLINVAGIGNVMLYNYGNPWTKSEIEDPVCIRTDTVHKHGRWTSFHDRITYTYKLNLPAGTVDTVIIKPNSALEK